jgi:hypothetical protein
MFPFKNTITRLGHYMVSVTTNLSERRDHPALGIGTFVGNLLLMSLISAMVKILATTH